MLKLIVLFVSIAVAFAALARYPTQEKPQEFANQEGCYNEDLKRVLPFDQPYHPDKECVQYTCHKSTNSVVRESCGAVLIKPGCQKTEDLSKPYPLCCPKEVCSKIKPYHL